ncbi:APC family permease [Corynebacterium incognita]|uniref:APC family permease n=1 Tax=Corynebacterium incognita TaxID=2754725 RepID=A0A7G7CQT2_9CORY|nr:APC family permease [Corynebacterium incognita]QNE89948.1 APC family permease [Corynebacterium incognita]
MNSNTNLARNYNPAWVFAMALGAAIGWGAFILPFDWMMSGGLAGTLIGFIIGGLLIGVIALSYGGAIRFLPVTGGGVAFALSALGRHHAFVAGWALALAYACIVALNASAVTLVFRVILPNWVMRFPLYEVAGWKIYLPEVLIASAFIILFAWMNSQGAEISGRFQFIAVLLLIGSVAVITVSMIVYYLVEQPTLAPGFPEDRSKLAAVSTIIAFAPWAYVGFDSIPQLAGEFNFSAKKAMNLILWGVGAATLVYMAMMLSTSIAVGTDHSQLSEAAWPPAVAIQEVMGLPGLVLMVVAVSVGVLTGLNGFFTATSRVLLTLGRSGLLPKWFAVLDQERKTPSKAIYFVALVCLITPWFGRAALAWIVDMSSLGVTVAYFYTCYFVFHVARTGKIVDAEIDVPHSLLQRGVSLVGCLLSVCFVALLLVPGSPGALGKESLIALGIWTLIGLLCYLVRYPKISRLDDAELAQRMFGGASVVKSDRLKMSSNSNSSL